MAANQRPNPRLALQDLLGDETQILFADGHDDAIVGFAERDGVVLVVYDVRKILRLLRVRDGMSRDEAQEFFDLVRPGNLWVDFHGSMVQRV